MWTLFHFFIYSFHRFSFQITPSGDNKKAFLNSLESDLLWVLYIQSSAHQLFWALRISFSHSYDRFRVSMLTASRKWQNHVAPSIHVMMISCIVFLNVSNSSKSLTSNNVFHLYHTRAEFYSISESRFSSVSTFNLNSWFFSSHTHLTPNEAFVTAWMKQNTLILFY